LTSRALFGVACQETMKTRSESHASYERLRIAKISKWQSRIASLAAGDAERPSSAAQRTEGNDCNRDGPAELNCFMPLLH
jgi:hypothetical protein